uniref:Uncharacterized protein n=1 Tax=Rangifer tarandus platyrhynchus TaxID=3082113 RepID=A0ACB0FD52_RANTA|nr:unnamed protein product [Rangifer tarandus platyrhynchus]
MSTAGAVPGRRGLHRPGGGRVQPGSSPPPPPTAAVSSREVGRPFRWRRLGVHGRECSRRGHCFQDAREPRREGGASVLAGSHRPAPEPGDFHHPASETRRRRRFPAPGLPEGGASEREALAAASLSSVKSAVQSALSFGMLEACHVQCRFRCACAQKELINAVAVAMGTGGYQNGLVIRSLLAARQALAPRSRPASRESRHHPGHPPVCARWLERTPKRKCPRVPHQSSTELAGLLKGPAQSSGEQNWDRCPNPQQLQGKCPEECVVLIQGSSVSRLDGGNGLRSVPPTSPPWQEVPKERSFSCSPLGSFPHISWLQAHLGEASPRRLSLRCQLEKPATTEGQDGGWAVTGPL